MCIEVDNMAELIVQQLGCKPYREVWEMQKQLFGGMVAAKRNGLQPDRHWMLLVEHLPVVTLGVHAHAYNLTATPEYMQQHGVEAIRIERGGDVTYHGPGQLVAYPILDLEERGIGVRRYVEILEETVIRTIARYGVKGHRIEGASGVWIGEEGEVPRKICALGIKCSRFVTMHGLALNVNTDLNGFGMINPCGFTDRGVTSLAVETGHQIDMAEVAEILVTEFKKQLGYNPLQ